MILKHEIKKNIENIAVTKFEMLSILENLALFQMNTCIFFLNLIFAVNQLLDLKDLSFFFVKQTILVNGFINVCQN
jgi:hypothetical protein